MDKFDDNYFDSEERSFEEKQTPLRRSRAGKEARQKKRWLFPLALLLILIVALGLIWFVGTQTGLLQRVLARFAPAEQEMVVALPSALFAGQDIEAAIARALEMEGVNEVTPGEGDTLIFKMTPQGKEKLLEDAEKKLVAKIDAFTDRRQNPFVYDLSYDGSYTEFSLVIDRDQEEFSSILTKASELFLLAAHYQHFQAAGDAVPRVTMTIEDMSESVIRERLVYPGDLTRIAALLESPEEVDERPRTPQAGDKVVVNTGPDNLNLRSGPEITYLIIDILSSGTILDVVDTQGQWLKVITPGQKEGWVHGNYVELVEGDS
ncbi:MAG: SH3 domain-containing protein [Bacillota bacterium]|nr:SH3 domain-containing protein [Bacillota bacterium]